MNNFKMKYDKMKYDKMKYDKMKFLKNFYYIILDFYYKTKYFIYFNIFLNVVFINYIYYTIVGVTNDKLILLLNYSINLNGCIIIKLIQWLNNHILFVKNDETKNTAIIKLFSKYYEDCNIHNLKYTKNLFLKEFGYSFDDIFILDETFSIKSGSIAQVYKAYFKNNSMANNMANNMTNNMTNNMANKNPIAIKVVHPELQYQMLFPIYFINIYKFFVTNFKFLKKYDTIINYDSFFYNLRNQVNMVNEYKNNEYFYNKYIANDVIVIPKPLLKSENFLIMEYIEGEFLDKMDVSIYKKQILMSFLSIFIKDTYMFGKYIHCDLHDANWKVLKLKKNNAYETNKVAEVAEVAEVDDSFIYKIIIYDFGYIIENKLNTHIKNLIYYLDLNNTYEIGKILFEHIENLKIKDTNSLEFLEYKENLISTFVKYNERCYPYTDSNLFACYNFCHSYDYKLKNNLLDLFVSIMLLNKYFKKYLFSNDHSNNEDINFNEKKYYSSVYNINLFYINICEKYDIFHNVKDFLN